MSKDSRFIVISSTWSWACRPRDRCPRWAIYIPGYPVAEEVLLLLEDLPRRPPVVPDGNNHRVHPSARNHQIQSCHSLICRHSQPGFDGQRVFLTSFPTLTQIFSLIFNIFLFFTFHFFFFFPFNNPPIFLSKKLLRLESQRIMQNFDDRMNLNNLRIN